MGLTLRGAPAEDWTPAESVTAKPIAKEPGVSGRQVRPVVATAGQLRGRPVHRIVYGGIPPVTLAVMEAEPPTETTDGVMARTTRRGLEATETVRFDQVSTLRRSRTTSRIVKLPAEAKLCVGANRWSHGVPSPKLQL